MKRKTLSLTLALCLVFSLFTWCGLTSTAEDIKPPDNNEVIQTTEPGEEAVPYLRLYEEEPDLFTVAYLNTDGTVTKTFYSFPVKYTDKDGNVKDISLDIQETKDGYATKENSVITEFGNELSDGIVLSSDDVRVEMIPMNESRSVFLPSDKRSLTYAVGDIFVYIITTN